MPMSALSVPRRSLSLRGWATPLVAGSFLLMGASGVAMFFHVETGLMKGLHEWAGWAMVAGGLAHLWLNRRAFGSYLKRPVAAGIMGLGAMLVAVGVLPLEAEGGPGAAVEAVTGAVAEAPVEELARLAGRDLPDVIAALAGAGLDGAGPQSSLADLAGGDRGAVLAGLAAVFAPAAE